MSTTSMAAVRVWDMNSVDRRYLDNLPEIVSLWHAHPTGPCRGEAIHEGIFYLSQDAGWDGARALAHTCVCAELHGVAIRSEYVIAIDFGRQTAQVMFDADL